MRHVEILAPGGSKEAIYAAVYSGADAVYAGIDRFSARAFAHNPTVDEMCEILDFAHLHGKKIYLTANTLLTEEELEGSFYTQLRPLYEYGLDAVIVQDFGVMEFVRQHFPDLDIHASTQMTLLTGEAGKLLQPYGVTRLVPARELTVGEIAQMRTQTDQEIEVFVHGALCYCYSGQCRMSEVIGGRSGNRGMCAQPCRLSYTVEDVESGAVQRGCFLSPADMCTLGRVDELIRAGVDSFKIEGRMKKPEYAAFTSHLYRLYADAALYGRTVEDREVKRDIRRLADIYNRGGFSEGYLFEPSKKNIIYTSKNGHFGVCTGEVVKVNEYTAEYRVTEKLYPQDVVEFRSEDGGCAYEYTLGEGAEKGERVRARYKKGSRLKVGQKVYRTKNSRLLQEISEMVEEGKKKSKIKVNGVFTAVCGSPVSLELAAGDCVCRVNGACAERAEGRPVRAEDIEKRLRKTGASEFEFETVTIDLPEHLFVPLGSIAALRREGFEQLRTCLCGKFHRDAAEQLPAERSEEGPAAMETPLSAESGSLHAGRSCEANSSLYTVIRVANFEHIRGVRLCQKANADNTRLCLKLDEFSPDLWEKLVRETGDFRYYISLPAVLRTKNKDRFLKYWDLYGAALAAGGCVGAVVNSIEALPLLACMEHTEGWELLAGPGLYCWNQRTQSVYRRFGIGRSLHMSYGRTAVMTTEGCVNMELGGCRNAVTGKRKICISTPKKDEFLVVNYCDYCYNVIYEKNPSWHDAAEFLTPHGTDGAAYIPEIAFLDEDAAEVGKVLEKWNFLS